MARLDENNDVQPQFQPRSQPPQSPSDAHLPPPSYQPAAQANHQYHQQTPPPGMSPGSYPQYQAPNPQPGIPVPNHQFPMPQTGKNGWQTSLFDCLDDPQNALITACCPWVTFGQIAEILDNGQTSCATSGMLYGVVLFCIAVPCLISCTYRTKLRNRYELIETPAPDWVTHFFCEPCALCQAYRELHRRGVDPSIGWQGNLQRQQAAMMPPMNNGMMHR